MSPRKSREPNPALAAMRRRIILPFVIALGSFAAWSFLIYYLPGRVRAVHQRLAGPPPALPASASRRDAPTRSAEIQGMTRSASNHIVGEIVNTGAEALELPRAWITLVDGDRVGRDVCQPPIWSLEPGEKVGCRARTQSDMLDTYDSARVELEPLIPAKARRPKVTVVDAVMSRKDGGTTFPASGTWIEGHVRNDSGRRLKVVWAIISVFGHDGQLTDAGSALVNPLADPPGAVAAGASGEFRFEVFTYLAEPATFAIVPSAVPEP